MTQLEYEEVRRRPNHFFVKPGHVLPGVERVVNQANGNRYQVVEKFGEAGKVAIRLDPRQSDAD